MGSSRGGRAGEPKRSTGAAPRFLRGCMVAPLDEQGAHAVGRLLGEARASDVADAYVVALAVGHRARIVTGDPDDIEALVAVCGVRLSIVSI